MECVWIEIGSLCSSNSSLFSEQIISLKIVIFVLCVKVTLMFGREKSLSGNVLHLEDELAFQVESGGLSVSFLGCCVPVRCCRVTCLPSATVLSQLHKFSSIFFMYNYQNGHDDLHEVKNRVNLQ